MPIWEGQMDPDMNGKCGWSATAEDPPCSEPATLHGFKMETLGQGTAHLAVHGIHSMMSSCAAHGHRLEANAHWVHPFGEHCGRVGSKFRWPQNECYMESTEGN